MQKINKYFSLMFFGVIVLSIIFSGYILAAPNAETSYTTSNITIPKEERNIDANIYNANIHWVETNITIDEKGNGIVTIEVNCTIEAGHLGIILKNLVDEANFLGDKSYAYSNNEKLEVNFTSYNIIDPYVLIHLINNSKAIAGNSIRYIVTYETNFYLNNQLSRYQVDTSLVSANFNRPTWEDELENQILRIELPIEVSGSTIPTSFLDEIKFDVSQQVEENYNISYYGRLGTDGKYRFVFEIEKSGTLPENSAFQAIFYLSFNYFSFPLMISWFVILTVFIICLLGLSLFIVIISLSKGSKKEMNDFKTEFYEILKKQEIH